MACRYGLEMDPEEALKIADEKYVDVDIHKSENAARLATLAQLPTCCAESAVCLENARSIYEDRGVFMPKMIDGIIAGLKAFDDGSLHQDADADPTLMKQLVDKYFYCG